MTKVPAIAPLTIPNQARRRLPWADNSRTPRVPLETSPEGELLEGKIVMPKRLCHTQPHTNERLEFDRIIRENLQRWAEWRRQRGWEMASKPIVKGPYTPPSSDSKKSKKFFDRAKQVIGQASQVREVTDFDEPEEVSWYFAQARFKRTTPAYIKLEDMLAINDMAKAYQVDLHKENLPWNRLPTGRNQLSFNGGLDPMAVAEARRQRLGLRRQDYLLGRLSDPL